MNKEQKLALAGIIFFLGILIYSAYRVLVFVPSYSIICHDEFRYYNLTTSNYTEYVEILEICLEYQENLRELQRVEFTLPHLNFSIDFENISVDMRNKTIE